MGGEMIPAALVVLFVYQADAGTTCTVQMSV